MKGIILAGGNATRLYPITKSISKHLLPVYDKPMIYYPLSVLMLAGIRDIMIITKQEDKKNFEKLFSDGSHLGLNISYAVQEKAEGIAQCFLIAEKFIQKNSVCLILGDNIFFGYSFSEILAEKKFLTEGAEIFAYELKNAKQYGVVDFDKDKNILNIEEKPKNPKSNFAVTGLYFYDNTVIEKAKSLKVSARGELEITDINKMYLAEKKLKLNILGRGFTWFDAGTSENLLQASNFVESIQSRQGMYIACLEEIAYRNKWLSKKDLKKLAKETEQSDYGKYIKNL